MNRIVIMDKGKKVTKVGRRHIYESLKPRTYIVQDTQKKTKAVKVDDVMPENELFAVGGRNNSFFKKMKGGGKHEQQEN